jgi:hypothetical protein
MRAAYLRSREGDGALSGGNSDNRRPEWTLGEGDSVWGRGIAEEWLVQWIEVGRLKYSCAPKVFGEMPLRPRQRAGR